MSDTCETAVRDWQHDITDVGAPRAVPRQDLQLRHVVVELQEPNAQAQVFSLLKFAT